MYLFIKFIFRRLLKMSNNVRPETMKRITTPELAGAFIDEQVALVQKQVGNKKSITRTFRRCRLLCCCCSSY